MIDSDIETMLAYYLVYRGGAADMIAAHAQDDIKTMALEIDHQREIANQLAKACQNLRATVTMQRKVLEKVKTYCEASVPHITEKHASFVVGTVVGMVNQGINGEIT